MRINVGIMKLRKFFKIKISSFSEDSHGKLEGLETSINRLISKFTYENEN